MKEVEIDRGVRFGFEGCEDIKRGVRIERGNLNGLSMEEVSVVGEVDGGGSLWSYGYQEMEDGIVVEDISV